ncbi:hypothetical protein [Gilvibacter sediminis]|uniref:hypothetical protein n=1 Tax=Gilvibacter sediminis TaxID=379071 RepID=UPI002350F72E|nr:hypothetical protein [Gilvibacter sediminis]MDC7997990.1 hypothetical protein [Gilvibacter sediminis]
MTDMIQKFGTKKFKKYVFIWLIALAVFIGVYRYFSPNSFQKDESEIDVILTDEMIDDIKQQTQQKLDSINNK